MHHRCHLELIRQFGPSCYALNNKKMPALDHPYHSCTSKRVRQTFAMWRKCLITYNQYQALRNSITDLIESAESDFIRNKLNNCQGSQTLWKGIPTPKSTSPLNILTKNTLDSLRKHIQIIESVNPSWHRHNSCYPLDRFATTIRLQRYQSNHPS